VQNSSSFFQGQARFSNGFFGIYHSPFGVELKGRNLKKNNAKNYRFGFQGQEGDDQIKGDGNSVNYEFRMHDPRLGRFFAVDPLAGNYSYNSPYAFSENRVIDGVELEGLEFSKNTTFSVQVFKKSLNQLKAYPEKINQAGAGTCVIAAVSYLWIKNEPKRFTRCMHNLYFNGSTTIHNFKINPDKSVFNMNIESSKLSINDGEYEENANRELDADWAVITSIQNSFDKMDNTPYSQRFLGYSDGSHSETSNTREDIVYLMKNLLGMSNVSYKEYSDKSKMNSTSVLNNLSNMTKSGKDCILMINANLLDNNNSETGDANHAVTFMGDLKFNSDRTVSFSVQSWGKKIDVRCTLEKFQGCYRGAVWGAAKKEK
jgi:RHS repeat-associated protein